MELPTPSTQLTHVRRRIPVPFSDLLPFHLGRKSQDCQDEVCDRIKWTCAKIQLKKATSRAARKHDDLATISRPFGQLVKISHRPECPVEARPDNPVKLIRTFPKPLSKVRTLERRHQASADIQISGPTNDLATLLCRSLGNRGFLALRCS
nr:hypothetical protein [Phytohabitans houttuyneae]